jgi:uncharacterized membrane protein YphA (DoxX/SURF4 family)
MIKTYPYIVVLIRFIVGGVFIVASYDKILDPENFAREISNYHVIPFGLENTIAIILPWVELLIGIGLIGGVFVKANSILTGTLLLIFNVLVFQAMVRGFNIECGCGLKERQMVGYGKLIENFLLLVGCCVIYKSKNKLLYAKAFQ